MALAALMGAATARGDEQKGAAMSYQQVREFLGKHTHLVELGEGDARVLITPQWQGRVMTSTCGGLDGRSFGFVHREFIEAAKPNLHFNNYGGEERLWLSPEGGPFSLWFKPGVKQTLEDWYTPPAFNEGGWKVVSAPTDPECRMEVRMALDNTAGAKFLLDVKRTIRLLGREELGGLLGPAASKLLAAAGVKTVGYETRNELINRGEPMTKEQGLVSIWMLGMLNCGSQTVVVVPYKPGDEATHGPAVKSDYFGAVPAERLKVLPEAVLFRADGKYRSKIGTSQQRAKNVLGSIDFAAGALCFVQFNMPDDPTKALYMNNMWGQQAESYKGDVANSYNDGPNELGQQLGAFYEIESLSPALPLKKDESLVHTQRTIHVQADMAVLAPLARAVLGVELDTVKREMLDR
jgi:hypothetical protein